MVLQGAGGGVKQAPDGVRSPDGLGWRNLVYHSSNLESIFFSETVTLIRNSAATEPSAGSWARKPDTHPGLVGQLSQVEQQTLRLKLLT